MIRPRPLRPLAIACVLTGAALAQVQEGDLLVNTSSGLRLYRPDGTFVAETTGATGSNFYGASFTPSGLWVSAFSSPHRGVALFDSTGQEVSTFPTPEVTSIGDVSVFSDGTIAVADQQGRQIELYTQAGVHQLTIQLPGAGRPFGTVVDADDELWVTDSALNQIHHYDQAGTHIGMFSTGACPSGDVDVAEDGTLWTILTDIGAVRHYSRNGTLLGSFSTGWFTTAVGCAVDMDGNIWVSRSTEQGVRRYNEAGNIIGTITIPAGQAPRFLAIFEPTLAVPYCSPAVPNSSGMPARILAEGSPFVTDNALTLTAFDLPPGEFGYFLVGNSQGSITPPGSDGVLCLTCGWSGCSGIGRFNQGGRIIQGPTGSIEVDLTNLPLSPPWTVSAGETWNFQCWYRDLNSNNFTDAVSVMFH
ncbi:MAG: hypothetical protein GY711_26510 [bacterium]|nr:hypothetical protein [bacterium]